VIYCAKKWPSDRSKRILFGGWLPGLKENPFFFFMVWWSSLCLR